MLTDLSTTPCPDARKSLGRSRGASAAAIRRLVASCGIAAICGMGIPACDSGAEVAKPAAGEAPTPALAPPTPPGNISISELRRQFDLEPSQGQFARTGGKITQVELFQTGVSDLSPLEELPLEILGISECPVSDLSPLSGMPLKKLSAQDTEVANLAPLADTELREIYLLGSPVSDISPLTDLPITHLNLVGTKVSDLTPIESMPLNTLWIGSTDIADLSVLREKSLVSLDIEGTPIANLAAISSMSTLRRLNIAETKVTDLTPLKEHRLERLIFDPSQVSKGLPLIRSMSSLRELGVSFDQRMQPSQFWAMYDSGGFDS